ncbi:hypothetical protein EHO59_17080 [Leptospira semungkisensis]|uniref:Uncharacterized protein n=1 Tax=Leptospira semungkisensis TaxID=2484985 RepID=A0A4V3JAR8_9LEPT|nr:hypothetical protein [Leptospira semungkisensis]TGJ99558.1 hypothetical protein EHO59_17080 [Leptospira semungkisensis]
MNINDIHSISLRYETIKYFQIGEYDVFIIIMDTQGAHCCSVVDVVSFGPKGKTYISEIPTPDEISFEDIDKDGTVDAITGNYLDYFHESHTDSPEADIYFRFKNGKFIQDKKAFYKIYERYATSPIEKTREKDDLGNQRNASLIASAAFYYVYLKQDKLALKLYLENGYEKEEAKSLIRELHERLP